MTIADHVAELRSAAKKRWDEAEALWDDNPDAARGKADAAERWAREADEVEAEPDSPATLAKIAAWDNDTPVNVAWQALLEQLTADWQYRHIAKLCLIRSRWLRRWWR